MEPIAAFPSGPIVERTEQPRRIDRLGADSERRGAPERRSRRKPGRPEDEPDDSGSDPRPSSSGRHICIDA
ncbi:MAG: hypothetical protein GC160_07625 [Acidobacteria bacterium]|nr:hypothetical protein [Acidobacteriota bacterium]